MANRNEPTPDGPTVHIPRQGRSQNPGPADEPPWWQTIYDRPAAPLHNPAAPPAHGHPYWGPPPSAPLPPQPAPQPDKRSGRRRKLIIIGCVVLAVEAAALVVGVVVLNSFTTTELDVTQAQNGVVQILQDPIDGYGATTVTDIRCNNGENPVIATNRTFDCTATIDGDKRRITAIFVDDAGTYEVQAPRD